MVTPTLIKSTTELLPPKVLRVLNEDEDQNKNNNNSSNNTKKDNNRSSPSSSEKMHLVDTKTQEVMTGIATEGTPYGAID